MNKVLSEVFDLLLPDYFSRVPLQCAVLLQASLQLSSFCCICVCVCVVYGPICQCSQLKKSESAAKTGTQVNQSFCVEILTIHTVVIKPASIRHRTHSCNFKEGATVTILNEMNIKIPCKTLLRVSSARI